MKKLPSMNPKFVNSKRKRVEDIKERAKVLHKQRKSDEQKKSD